MESLNVQKRVEMLKVPKYVNKVLYLVPYRPHTKNVQKTEQKRWLVRWFWHVADTLTRELTKREI
jgi:hypothetical protein